MFWYQDLFWSKSSLTGESIPVVKIQPEDDKSATFDPEVDKSHCIYSSTVIVSASPDTIAMVVRTGFRTTKGQLVKSILHGKPFTYILQQQTFYFLFILSAMGFVLFWGVFNPEIGLQTKEQILYGFEAIVCLVPPLLPIVFEVVLLVSAKRIESYSIYTTSPSRIPIAGKVKTMCFDKTGTLTKSDLEVIGVVSDKTGFDEILPVNRLKEDDELLHALTTCHSLIA